MNARRTAVFLQKAHEAWHLPQIFGSVNQARLPGKNSMVPYLGTFILTSFREHTKFCMSSNERPWLNFINNQGIRMPKELWKHGIMKQNMLSGHPRQILKLSTDLQAFLKIIGSFSISLVISIDWLSESTTIRKRYSCVLSECTANMIKLMRR